MNSAIERIVGGYRVMFRSVFRFIVGTVVLLAVSSAITVPLWYVADRFPGFFNVAVLTAVAGTIVFSFTKYVTSAVRTHGRKRVLGRIIIRVGMYVVLVFGVVGAISSRSIPAVLTAGVAILTVVAWRVHTR